MKRKPRLGTSLFSAHDARWFLEVAALTATATLIAFWLGLRSANTQVARSLAFTAVILAQQFIFWDVASADRQLFNRHTLKNWWLILPLPIMVVQMIIIYIPVFARVFALSAPTVSLLLLSVLVTSGMLLVASFRKRFLRKFFYPAETTG